MSDCNWTNHLNSWLIQERNAVMLLRDLIIFIVEKVQKQQIWRLKQIS